MALSLRNERRHRKAVELICKRLQIDDEAIDAYIDRGRFMPFTKTAKKKK
jgi:hypothetical protein